MKWSTGKFRKPTENTLQTPIITCALAYESRGMVEPEKRCLMESDIKMIS